MFAEACAAAGPGTDRLGKSQAGAVLAMSGLPTDVLLSIWSLADVNGDELVDLNEDGLEDFKDMLLSLGYPLLTENVVDHIIYKFPRSDYVSHKHREERAAYFSNKTFALDNPNAWCARSAVEELDDDGEQSGASEAAPEAATRGRAADGAMIRKKRGWARRDERHRWQRPPPGP